MYGDIDYQDQFDIAELLFRKHVLKDSETPYEDYFNDVGKFVDHGTCEGYQPPGEKPGGSYLL